MVIVTDKEYYMSSLLKQKLDSFCFNLEDDFDFMILVSGSGDVRIGKSVLAGQIGYYFANKLGTPFDATNWSYSGKEVKDKARNSPKHSAIVYDEGVVDLDSSKVNTRLTRELETFFAQCGQYNHVLIVVVPDFFRLPSSVALTRSWCLINVYGNLKYTRDKESNKVVKIERGYFSYYDKEKKKELYLKGKKFKNYKCVSPLFRDRFTNKYCIDEQAYREKKREVLEEIQEERIGKREQVYRIKTFTLIKHLLNNEKYTRKKVAGILGDTPPNLTQFLEKCQKDGLIL